MNEEARKQMEQRMEELSGLITAYPLYIPIHKAAEFLHMKEDGLRASIEQGNCLFGLCWRTGERMAYKIPTVTFVRWYAKGA